MAGSSKRKVRKQAGRRRRYRKVTWRRLYNHPNPLVSIIIPAMNEAATLPAVLKEAGRVHPCSETIVVANGCSDGTPELAAKWGAKLIVYSEPLGHDVGRRVGAEAAQGEVLLFIDADMVIPARELRIFVDAVLSSGVDVALNRYSGPRKTKEAHPVVVAKHVLNSLLSRPDLSGSSMTAVPHALSRRGLEMIGVDALEIPPLAHAKAITRGLKVQAVHNIPVGRLNPVRYKRQDPLTPLVAGDHLEAIHWIISEFGPRGGFSDLGRRREKVRL